MKNGVNWKRFSGSWKYFMKLLAFFLEINIAHQTYISLRFPRLKELWEKKWKVQISLWSLWLAKCMRSSQSTGPSIVPFWRWLRFWIHVIRCNMLSLLTKNSMEAIIVIIVIVFGRSYMISLVNTLLNRLVEHQLYQVIQVRVFTKKRTTQCLVKAREKCYR